MSKTRLFKLATYVSIGYLIFIASSLLFSTQLPHLNDLPIGENLGCYWTNAFFAYVECERDVSAYELRQFFYNYWLDLIYLPMMATASIKLAGIAFLLYTPIAFLGFALFRSFRRKLQKRRHAQRTALNK